MKKVVSWSFSNSERSENNYKSSFQVKNFRVEQKYNVKDNERFSSIFFSNVQKNIAMFQKCKKKKLCNKIALILQLLAYVQFRYNFLCVLACFNSFF